MAEKFAVAAYKQNVERIHMFVSGAMQGMLGFAYDTLDDIVAAYEAKDDAKLSAIIEAWRDNKEQIINNNIGNDERGKMDEPPARNDYGE